MTATPKPRLVLGEGDIPAAQRWIAALEDCRQRTLITLARADDAVMDEPADAAGNTIGTLLYHVAAIEADWVFDDILGGAESGAEWPADLFPWDVRDEAWILTKIRGTPLAEHLDRLAKAHAFAVGHLSGMTADDFVRVRERDGYDVAPDWAVHHLMQHEAEHRAQIDMILTAAGRPPD